MHQLLLSLLGLSASCPGATPSLLDTNYTEEEKTEGKNLFLDAWRRSVRERESDMMSAHSQIEGTKNLYRKFNNRVRAPGFISAAPIPQIAKIVGPTGLEESYRMGDTLYARWSGAPLPKPGERFAAYTPAVVLQNLEQPADFEVFHAPGPFTKLPSGRRLAGYFYEESGRVVVKKVRNGLVELLLEQMKGQVTPGSELMQLPPKLDNITPIRSGIQISAAVICGSPHDRLSTTKRSFIYINRGSRDGIRVGRVFESVEAVKLNEAVRGSAPESSNGEAIVVHTTDAYSTAMITKQFDVIRMGSLLRTQQEDSPTTPGTPFSGFENYRDAAAPRPEGSVELPSVVNLPAAAEQKLPDPRRRPSPPQLSELDALEKELSTKELSESEKARLEKLSRQEKLGTQPADEDPEENQVPVESSFKQGKSTAKKDLKKSKKAKTKNDEEELNLLMMQN